MNYGMFRVASASLKLKVANPSYNKVEIKKAIYDAEKQGVRLLVTPELSITGFVLYKITHQSIKRSTLRHC